MNVAFQKKLIFSIDSKRLNNSYFYCKKYRGNNLIAKNRRNKEIIELQNSNIAVKRNKETDR